MQSGGSDVPAQSGSEAIRRRGAPVPDALHSAEGGESICGAVLAEETARIDAEPTADHVQTRRADLSNSGGAQSSAGGSGRGTYVKINSKIN